MVDVPHTWNFLYVITQEFQSNSTAKGCVKLIEKLILILFI